MSFAAGLQGAMLLAKGRPEGARLMAGEGAAVARSFWAAPICLPGFIALRLLDWADAGWPPRPLHAAGLELLAYVIGWAGFALASRQVVAGMEQEARWPRFIVAWNWCNVIQYVLLLAGAVPELLGAPSWAAETSSLVVAGWALWLEWFATRVTLGIGAVGACAIVALDLFLGISLTSLVDALSGVAGG
ncbi:MAG TPA: hypothetical protein VMI52_15095 [Acetobacteraceae bacterium]|nr:hypothetical protein [Acetobacteraceae bacterium]